MPIAIRDVREHELDSILALNNAAGPAILPLDAARIRRFHDTADYFRVAERDGNLAGFLVGFGPESEHDSSNFRWFRERYPVMFEEFRRRRKAKPLEIGLGDVFLWREDGRPAVFNLGTQPRPGRVATYPIAETALKALRAAADEAGLAPEIGRAHVCTPVT